MTFRERLIKMNACQEAVDWVGDKDLATAWRECERADWMLWLAGRCKTPHKTIVLCAIRCSETSAKYDTKGDNRAKECRKTVRRWLRGQATRQELRSAAYSADSARSAAYSARSAAYSADSAYSAADSARSAYSAAYSADSAYSAAHSAAYSADSADSAAYSAARKNADRLMADIVRKTIPLKYLTEDK